MLFSLISINNVFASDADLIIIAELENAIISGSGTLDDPYEVNYEDAPEFKRYMDYSK